MTSVLRNLDRELYEAVPVGVTKEGCWFRYDGPTEAIADGSWEQVELSEQGVLAYRDAASSTLMANR